MEHRRGRFSFCALQSSAYAVIRKLPVTSYSIDSSLLIPFRLKKRVISMNFARSIYKTRDSSNRNRSIAFDQIALGRGTVGTKLHLYLRTAAAAAAASHEGPRTDLSRSSCSRRGADKKPGKKRRLPEALKARYARSPSMTQCPFAASISISGSGRKERLCARALYTEYAHFLAATLP